MSVATMFKSYSCASAENTAAQVFLGLMYCNLKLSLARSDDGLHSVVRYFALFAISRKIGWRIKLEPSSLVFCFGCVCVYMVGGVCDGNCVV